MITEEQLKLRLRDVQIQKKMAENKIQICTGQEMEIMQLLHIIQKARENAAEAQSKLVKVGERLG